MRRLETRTGVLAQIVGLLGAVALLIGAFFIGAMVLAVIVGLAVIGAIVFRLRLWWLRRQMAGGGGRGGDAGGHRVIEGEYRHSRRDR